MHILEHGQGQEKTLLFLPCTAEPVWAFEKTVALLGAVVAVFPGRLRRAPSRLIPAILRRSEQTVDEITGYLRAQGVTCLDAAYGWARSAAHV